MMCKSIILAVKVENLLLAVSIPHLSMKNGTPPRDATMSTTRRQLFLIGSNKIIG